ncbi:MAG: hypothetical protein ACFFCL_16740, partial [Promethearchaeota archaeon]
MGFALTELYFFLILVSSYFLILLWILVINIKKGMFNIFKLDFTNEYKREFINNFSILDFIKRFRFSKSVVLIVFIFLICIFGVFGASIFIGTDPWMHISIIKFITNIHYLPVSDYFGTFG